MNSHIKYLLYIGVIIVLLSSHIFGYRLGVRSEKAKQEKINLSIANSRVDTLKQQATINSDVDSQYISKQKDADTRIKTIIKKVPVYVTKEDDSKCVIGPGVIKLHNDAISQ